MKEKLIEKINQHIEMLLEKPVLTNEDYMVIYNYFRDIKIAEETAMRDAEFDERMKKIFAAMDAAMVGGGNHVQ